jgi:hypothetical protein
MGMKAKQSSNTARAAAALTNGSEVSNVLFLRLAGLLLPCFESRDWSDMKLSRSRLRSKSLKKKERFRLVGLNCHSVYHPTPFLANRTIYVGLMSVILTVVLELVVGGRSIRHCPYTKGCLKWVGEPIRAFSAVINYKPAKLHD